MYTISHDAFDRVSLIRRQVDSHHQTCAECGNRNRNGRLFQYGSLPDDRLSGHVNWHPWLFCSVGCYRVYQS